MAQRPDRRAQRANLTMGRKKSIVICALLVMLPVTAAASGAQNSKNWNMALHKRYIIISVFVLSFHFIAPAFADGPQPLESVQKGVEEGLRILNDPAYAGSGRREAQQQHLMRILEQLFDFEEFSRRVLAADWINFSPAQQKTFVAVFTEFLSKYYIGKILDKYKDERVVYLDQTFESPSLAQVNVEVIWRQQPVPVELPMIKRRGVWKIYEIRVLGISAVSFYRAQFKSLLRHESPAQIIARIKDRIRYIQAG